ncbi:hypothetical protein BZG36_01746 [Bifiguratus adelaidae]|uniref:Ribosomal protein S6 n=1 Tax=Bifiguratus adelaidae TaxID=1938954 RepID=A0A261Y2X9_9FUNG|nr:hypothetical protein BZG36_01746 [Bifiguratus adelaidae]
MPFYELVCIARSNLLQANLKDLVRTSTLQILDHGGVVRGFQNLGDRPIPHRIKKHQVYHNDGKYWLMHFDTNPTVVEGLTKKLRTDPRVIRHTVVRLGSKLEDVLQRPDQTR